MMRGRLSIGLLLASWLGIAYSQTAVHDGTFVPDHVLRITLANVSIACETRLSVVVNGSIPGPPIRLVPGASSWIRVYNDMEHHNLTMHWHGLAQRMAPFADGSPLASQWPIPPGAFFDYQVETQLLDAGTYFCHSHVEMQALSAFCPLIVDDCGEAPAHYDDERLFLFSDFYKQPDDNLTAGLLSVPFKWTGETQGVMLNGQGIGVNHTAVPGPKGGVRGMFGSLFGPSHVPAEDGATCSLPVIDVDPGKTYRFRMIGATGLSLITMALEGHGDFTVIQVDGGEYNVPINVNHMQIGSGQRFDVLFKAKTAAELEAAGKSTFYFQFETRDRPTTLVSYAVLRYNKDVEVPVPPAQPIFDNTTLPVQMGDWLEYALTPLYPERSKAPKADEVTRRIIIDSVQLTSNVTGGIVWELAHLSWTEYVFKSPALVDIYLRGDEAIPNWDAAMANHGWDPRTRSFPVRVGEVLEIVLQNTGSLVNNGGGVDSHPFHPHGQHVFDFGSGDGTYDPVANEEKIKRLNYVPVRRDTTMLHRYTSKTTAGAAAGWRTWRIRIEQPGVWMLHCHTLQHMIMGMQSVWVVGNASEILQIPLDMAQGYLLFGGSALGNDTNEPEVYVYFNGTNQCGLVHDQCTAVNENRPVILDGTSKRVA